LSLGLSGFRDRLLASIRHRVFVLRQTTENSTATDTHPRTQVLNVALARGAPANNPNSIAARFMSEFLSVLA